MHPRELLCLPPEPGEVGCALCGTVDRRPGAPQRLDQWLGPERTAQNRDFPWGQCPHGLLLAYSTISQIGYMVLGLGIGTPLAIAAGLFHCLNHGLFKGSLFLCAGSVQHACGTRDMDRLGGLGRRMPRTMAIWLVASASIAGLPLLNGFVGKWLLFNAALEARQPLLALVPWIGTQPPTTGRKP